MRAALLACRARCAIVRVCERRAIRAGLLPPQVAGGALHLTECAIAWAFGGAPVMELPSIAGLARAGAARWRFRGRLGRRGAARGPRWVFSRKPRWRECGL